ncbi:hypothetical protein EUX98_g2540 [Antrodiella citrinella]|uniref:F-box domain-containing protein n=1 Tax=Antrodiella citrinella TaxID=2447956 RepID=A0A4S4MYS7_9APHY|nr:hypothetical protein EUX98_g2540 [Antrodiella citrinella]
MAALAPRGTNLTSLTLLPCGMTAEQASVICAVIQKAVHLRKLRIAMDASGVLWDAASQLPSLQWLSVDFENLHTFMLGARSTRRVFSDLTFLDIRTPEIAYATMLLHDSLHPQLRHLQYLSQAERQASHALATSLFEAIADSCSPAVLTDLDFFIENLEELSEEHLIFDPIRSSALRPLLRFTRLTTFSLDLFWSWDLDNSLIQEMAHAWPQLKVLRLDPNFYGPPAESRITLRGLEPLAMHCPHLQVFGATIDATTLPADGPLPIINTGQAPQSPLTSLLVGDSKIQSFLRVARYLSRLFPALQRIQTYDLLNVWEGMEEEVEFAGELWREVVTLVQVMALVREQERRTPSVSDIANA